MAAPPRPGLGHPLPETMEVKVGGRHNQQLHLFPGRGGELISEKQTEEQTFAGRGCFPVIQEQLEVEGSTNLRKAIGQKGHIKYRASPDSS